MPAPIVLLTDFGHTDPYVGQMKGALATLAPHVPVIDLCHGVRPQAVAQGAYFLASSFSHFPEGSVFVCVVDPGVGTDRGILCAEVADRFVLAPDNGLLVPLLSDYPAAACYRMDTDIFEDAAPTFHGRDIFCPLAAKLAGGEPVSGFGVPCPVSQIHTPEWMVPVGFADHIACHVQHIDHFGNVVLNLSAIPWLERIALWPDLFIRQTPPQKVLRTTTFGQLPRNTLGCIAGSQGFLELVLHSASAAHFLKLDIGDSIVLQGHPDVDAS